MVWTRNLCGLKVVQDGRYIGRVIQAALSDDLTLLDGIWIDRALLGVRFIAAEHICVLGKSSVTVEHSGDRMRLKPRRLFVRAVTTDGLRAGAVTDAALDEQTLTVTAILLADSWFTALTGKARSVCSYKYDALSSRIIILRDKDESEVIP